MNGRGPGVSLQASAAIDLARRGWHVFPSPRGRKAGYHELRQELTGTRWGCSADPDIVRDRFSGRPDANVCIACEESRIFVVEGDTKHSSANGVKWLEEEIARHDPWPDTIEALSPSGSWHLYFRWPEGLPPKTCESQVAPGVDVRGRGGMVVAPPSGRPGAKRPYTWKNPPGLFEPAECPAWLMQRVPRVESQVPAVIRSSSDNEDRAGIAEVADLLRYIDPDKDYGTWVAILMALHDHGSGGAAWLGLAEEWSARGAKFRPGEIASKWVGFLPGKGVGIGTICDHARSAGADLSDIARRNRSGPVRPSDCALSVTSGRRFDREPVLPQDTSEPEKPLFSAATRWAGLPVPERLWHIRDFIPDRQVSLLYGDGGDGKSLLALQLAIATASGTPWIGQIVERPGRALYLGAEDEDDELHRRTVGICNAAGIPLSRIDFFTRSLAGEDALLASFAKNGALEVTPLQRRLEAEVARLEPRLLVLDTLADFHSGNEIEKTVARQFISLQRGLAIRHGCAVVILAHPSLTGMSSGSGTSGNTAWSNSARSRLYLQRVREDGYETDPNARKLSLMKANYSASGLEIDLTYRDGAFQAADVPTGLDRMAATAKARRVFLKLLKEFQEANRPVRSTTGHGYAPAVFAKSGRAEGLGKAALHTAMETLFDSGEIVIVEEGPPSRRIRSIHAATP